MRYSLLDMTQQILRSMKGDEVNTVSGTAESEAVAHIIKENYFNIVGELNLPEHYDFFELVATNSVTPTVMTKPEGVINIDWIKYDNISDDETDQRFTYVNYKPINEFMDMMDMLSTDDADVSSFNITIGTASILFKYRSDKHPQWFTTPDDNRILFDSYDVAEDANLQANKTQCYGLVAPVFLMEDAYVPDIDQRQFQLLLQSAKAQCFTELKQVQNPDAEKKVRRNWINTQKNKQDIPTPWPAYKNIRSFGRR